MFEREDACDDGSEGGDLVATMGKLCVVTWQWWWARPMVFTTTTPTTLYGHQTIIDIVAMMVAIVAPSSLSLRSPPSLPHCLSRGHRRCRCNRHHRCHRHHHSPSTSPLPIALVMASPPTSHHIGLYRPRCKQTTSHHDHMHHHNRQQ